MTPSLILVSLLLLAQTPDAAASSEAAAPPMSSTSPAATSEPAPTPPDETATDKARNETVDTRRSIAVLQFKTEGLTEEETRLVASSLTGIVTAEVAKQDLRVVSQDDIAAMLSFEEMKTTLACEEGPSCLAEVGGALGTDLFLSGGVFKLGGAYNLTMTLIEIDTAKVLKRFQGTAGSLNVLPDTARRGVAVLFEQRLEAAGTLFVKTLPAGAQVLIDGRPAGKSPLTVGEIAVGDHEVTGVHKGVRISRRVYVKPNDIARLEIDLTKPPPVSLLILSDPPEAQVFIDGEAKGTTPLVLRAIPSGNHRYKLVAPEHQDLEGTFTLSFEDWDRGGRVPLKQELALPLQPVKLIVVGAVASAKVYVDGKESWYSSEHPPGEHTVKVEAPGYQTVERRVTLKKGESDREVRVVLQYTPEYQEYLDGSAMSGVLFHTGLWTGVATGVLGGLAFGAAFGLDQVAQLFYADYLAATDESTIQSSYDFTQYSAQGSQVSELVSYSLLGIAVVGAATAITGLVLSPEDPTGGAADVE